MDEPISVRSSWPILGLVVTDLWNMDEPFSSFLFSFLLILKDSYSIIDNDDDNDDDDDDDMNDDPNVVANPSRPFFVTI